jgi:Glycosyl transferases group 1
MIEAMACGTPVIAFRSGSVPEVVDQGITGFVVSDEEEAIQAIARLGELDRRRIRAQFEKRFTSRRMAEEYLNHYAALAPYLNNVKPHGLVRINSSAHSSIDATDLSAPEAGSTGA